jgi:hypothetical protein|tara:strand:+ start:1007 stop:1441 length:435 start_codon:yes stop_codon:yes gene_type:complete
MDNQEELFKGVTFSDLMSDVYHNSKRTSRQINQLVSQLQPLIRSSSDATIIVPLIKEYLEVSVKNDDHLVKLTAIVQRYISTKQTIVGSDSLLSDEEKKQLLQIADDTLTGDLESELNLIEQEESQLHQKIETAKSKLKQDNHE